MHSYMFNTYIYNLYICFILNHTESCDRVVTYVDSFLDFATEQSMELHKRSK